MKRLIIATTALAFSVLAAKSALPASTLASWDFLTPDASYPDGSESLLIGDGGNGVGTAVGPLAQFYGLSWSDGQWTNLTEVASGIVFFVPGWLDDSETTHLRFDVTYSGLAPSIIGIAADPVSDSELFVLTTTSPRGSQFQRIERWDMPSPDRQRIALLVPTGTLIDQVVIATNTATGQPGDVNFDGLVDVFDINFVSSHWDGTGPEADANGDGAVNIFDINLISANWTPDAPSATSPVPEPNAAALGVTALMACTFWQISRRMRRS